MNTPIEETNAPRYLSNDVVIYPTLILLKATNIRVLCAETEESIGFTLDEKEIFRKLFELVEYEQYASLRIEEYCDFLKYRQSNGFLSPEYSEKKEVMNLLTNLGRILVADLKQYGMYKNGRLDYLFDTFKMGHILVRHRKSYYDILKKENARLS